jgi:Tfp pilus assembly protein PilN
MSDINLIPERRRQRKRYQRRLHLWVQLGVVYLLCLGTALGSAYAMWAGDDAVMAKKLENAETRIERTQDTILKLRKQYALCRAQLLTHQALDDQPDWSRLMLLMAEAMDHQITLQTCRLVTLDDQERDVLELVRDPEAAVPTDTILMNRDYHLHLSGFARAQTAVSLFVLRLERLELFTSVRLEKSRRQTFLGAPAVAFTIECKI